MGRVLPAEPDRAAPTWAEAVTEAAATRVPGEVYELARRHFTDKGLVELVLAVVAINRWNRLAIGFRKVPGAYQPVHQAQGRSDGVVEAHRQPVPRTRPRRGAFSPRNAGGSGQ